LAVAVSSALGAELAAVPLGLQLTERLVAVRGKVVDGMTGRGVGGAQIVVEGDTTPYPRGPVAMAADDGAFQLQLRPGARVVLSSKMAGYSGGGYGQLFSGDSSSSFYVPSDQTAVAVTLRLWKTGVIVGRVFDESGDPLVGLNIWALRSRSIGPPAAGFIPPWVCRGSEEAKDRTLRPVCSRWHRTGQGPRDRSGI
jgi:hypothetical protein